MHLLVLQLVSAQDLLEMSIFRKFFKLHATKSNCHLIQGSLVLT